ncbi:AAA family ATPase [Microbacterium sp. KUDC0406]|uniref:AAA family ATPase n=1 Tax=Microbacterium sp. KUDC0406 TaxID=2909588 RepID=UPI002E33A46B|nr:AAA family ATPase [Microbacterium sp. KUDC0406]
MDPTTPTEVIFIGGRAGVGKTSVAAEASRLLAQADVRHAVIEGDNLDQAHPEPWRAGIDLAEQNLAAMWGNYRRIGYSRLIFTNTVSVLEMPTLVAALGGNVQAFGVLLTATDATASERLAKREIGTALSEHIVRSGNAAGEAGGSGDGPSHRHRRSLGHGHRDGGARGSRLAYLRPHRFVGSRSLGRGDPQLHGALGRVRGRKNALRSDRTAGLRRARPASARGAPGTAAAGSPARLRRAGKG